MQFQSLKGGDGIPEASWVALVSVRSPAFVSKLESMEEDLRSSTTGPMHTYPHMCPHMCPHTGTYTIVSIQMQTYTCHTHIQVREKTKTMCVLLDRVWTLYCSVAV